MKKILFSLCIILLSFGAISPLLQPGFFPLHDNAQVSRVYEMGKALAGGMLPVRWIDGFGYGYGYPIFNFYAPLAYYIGAILMFLLGTDVLIATKIMVAIGIVIAGIGMYLLAREFWGDTGGLVSGLLYVYAPYHALDTYVRGDITELWGYACIPFVFYAIWKSYKEQRWRYVFLGAIGFSALILSHNLTAMMVVPFVLLVIGYLYRQSIKEKNKRIYYPLKIVFLGLLLSAFYWLPVFFEIPYTNVLSQIGGGFDFHKNFVCVQQFWYSPWGYGGSVPGCTDGLSFMLGKLPIALSIVSVILALIFFKKYSYAKLSIAVFITLVLVLLLTTEISTPIWNLVYPLKFFQFPWRFLLFAAFLSSFLSGFSVFLVRRLFKDSYRIIFNFCVIILLLVIVISNNKFFQPKTIDSKNIQSFSNKDYIEWRLSNDAHEYLPKNFHIPQSIAQIPSRTFVMPQGSGTVIKIIDKTQTKKVQIIANRKSNLHINIAYFPAWHIYINNKESTFSVVNNGMNVTIPAGSYPVSAEFHQTFIEKLGNSISLLGILLLIADIILKRRNIFA